MKQITPLNEFVLIFRCRRCGTKQNKIIKCDGKASIVKAAIGNPVGSCIICGSSSEWVITGVSKVEVG